MGRLRPIGPSEMLQAARSRGRRRLTEPEAKSLLEAVGIAVPPGGIAHRAADAEKLARDLGLPVAVKVVSPDLTHKSEAGGIICPVTSAAEAGEAYAAVIERTAHRRPDTAIEGVLVEKYQAGGIECILGLRIDERFGPVVMFGLGGVFVEVLHDVTFRLAPLNDRDVLALLGESRGARCLGGFRGQPAVDKPALGAAIRACAEIAFMPGVGEHISDLEINPLQASARGAVALDAVVTLRP
jgi:acetyl-CoA synthetase (ADP-forming)